jgi:hypothetical protein
LLLPETGSSFFYSRLLNRVGVLQCMSAPGLGAQRARPALMGASRGGWRFLGKALAVPQRKLALQVESCSPRLIASRVDACWLPSGFRPGFWPQGQSKPVYSSETPPTPKAALGSVRRLRQMAPELPKPDIRPQLREMLAWYEDVLERIAAGALVGPGVAERLREEQNLTARYLDLLDAGEESSQPTE